MSDNQRLPNLYQLLGLSGTHDGRDKIEAALKRAQARLETLKKDGSRSDDVARLQKVIALSQKYLLNPDLKKSYDSQWSAIYGSSSPAQAGAGTHTSAGSTASSSTKIGQNQTATAVMTPPRDATERETTEYWDMSALDQLLPDADPHAPFQMAEYLRTSQVRDPMAAEADLRKLISLLGGEELPAAAPVMAQPISLSNLFDSEASPQETRGPVETPSVPETDSGIPFPRSTSPTASVGLAKRMRKKRQQALLFGGIALAAGVGGLFLLSMYLNQPTPKPANTLSQVAPPTNKRNAKPMSDAAQPGPKPTDTLADPNSASLAAANAQSMAGATGLIQPGENVKPMEIQATPLGKPDGMAEKPVEPMKPEPMKPEPMKPEAMKPEPMKPEAPNPDAPKPGEPMKPEGDKPEGDKPEGDKPEMSAEVKLTGKEKSAWQKAMKEVRAGLGKLDPVASEKQIAELTPLAKTPQQKTHLATLEEAVGLIRRARQAIVAAIGGLESAETFTVGTSTEVSFIEGDETRIVYFSNRQRKEYKLEAMPVGVGIALMKLEPNVIDANLSAAMGAYALVHPSNGGSTQGKKLLEEAAASGAISKELSTFYADDFKLD